MPELQFCMTSFGSQKSTKKVLLLHGLMGTGPVFFKVAERLVKDGYVSGSNDVSVPEPQTLRLPDAPLTQ